MTAPDHEEDEEAEDPEIDEQMDTGVRTEPQRHDDDETSEEITHDGEPDVLSRQPEHFA